ncbi:16247_t:CDS:2, partial [Acaulospora colombiana]
AEQAISGSDGMVVLDLSRLKHGNVLRSKEFDSLLHDLDAFSIDEARRWIRGSSKSSRHSPF